MDGLRCARCAAEGGKKFPKILTFSGGRTGLWSAITSNMDHTLVCAMWFLIFKSNEEGGTDLTHSRVPLQGSSCRLRHMQGMKQKASGESDAAGLESSGFPEYAG